MANPVYPHNFYKFGKRKSVEMDDITIQVWINKVAKALESGEPHMNISSGNTAVIGI